jgi:predicted nucleic acid-binding protein
MLYLDSTVLVKLYLTEPESAATKNLVELNKRWLFTSVITKTEVLAALVRADRAGRLGTHGYDLAKITFLHDWEGLQRLDVTLKTLLPAERVIERHGLRGFDAIHLCTALLVGYPDFACFDNRLRAAAIAEGLRVVP